MNIIFTLFFILCVVFSLEGRPTPDDDETTEVDDGGIDFSHLMIMNLFDDDDEDDEDDFEEMHLKKLLYAMGVGLAQAGQQSSTGNAFDGGLNLEEFIDTEDFDIKDALETLQRKFSEAGGEEVHGGKYFEMVNNLIKVISKNIFEESPVAEAVPAEDVNADEA